MKENSGQRIKDIYVRSVFNREKMENHFVLTTTIPVVPDDGAAGNVFEGCA